MDDHQYRSRGKRSYSYDEQDHQEPSGRHKKVVPILPKFAPGDTVFRLLCPEPKVGRVIGKGGSIVKNLRHETGANIIILDNYQDAKERVIYISSFKSDRERVRDRKRGSLYRDRDSTDVRMSPAQDALMQVHARILEGRSASKSNANEEDASQTMKTRLLVPKSQVGCLIGKRGHVIKRMCRESNAHICILPGDEVSLCSLPGDNIVQIKGDANTVKKALQLISTLLFENPPHERHPGASHSPSRGAFLVEDLNSPYQPPLRLRGSYNAGQHQKGLRLSHSDYGPGASIIGGHSHGSGKTHRDDKWDTSGSNNDLVFRILCPREKTGCINGKGGSFFRNLREEIGVSINVCDPVAGSDETVVRISSAERPDDDISPAQDALLFVQRETADLGPDEDAVITSRLLVSPIEIHWLLGESGNTIAKIRRSTGANIRILGRGDVPACALPTDEVVQIVAGFHKARNALLRVTRTIRSNFHINRSLEPGGVSLSLGNSIPRNRHDFLSPGGIDLAAPGAQNSGLASSSHAYWTGQDLIGGSHRHHEVSDWFRATGVMVIRATVEILIPNRIAGLIFSDGSTISQICQMSGAQVDFLNVKTGAADVLVKISGTPEQTQLAQVLLQGVMMQTSRHPNAWSPVTP